MIEAEYAIEVPVPVEGVWSYVEDMENWAPYLIGFQRLNKIDERRSIWTLKGDVGILTREVDIQADITVWEPPRRAEFTITGVTERINGQGTFELTTVSAGDPPAPVTKDGPLRRARFAVARWLLRLVNRRAVQAAPAPQRPAGSASVHGRQSRLEFRLQVAPAGPMAPMIELLMRPMVEPAAQDFLRNVRQDLEGR
jgi:carbon monoxide dehydrogenase subunit G